MRSARCILALSLALLLSAGLCRSVRADAEQDRTDEQVAKLIEQLGDEQYAVRERAQRELTKIGFLAFDALNEAQEHPDIEVANQARYLVRQIRLNWAQEADPPAVKQLLKDYDPQDDDGRLLRVKELAELADGAGMEALCRIARFDPAQVVAKQAAVELIDYPPAGDESWTSRAKLINDNFQRSKRTTAEWLKALLVAHDDPAAGVDQWIKLAAAERETLRQTPKLSHYRLILELLKQQAYALEQLHRDADAQNVMREMVAVEQGGTETLGELVEWLTGRKAWTIVDEVVARFSERFEGDAELSYRLAEARLIQGDGAAAEELGKKALAITGKKVFDHLLVADRLQERGLMRWSDREFQYVIDTGPANSAVALKAAYFWSESLHDRDLDEQAAEVRGKMVAVMASDEVAKKNTDISTPIESIRSRMHYFLACHYANQKDYAKQIAQLEQGIADDPADVDILIALYHLDNRTPDERAKTLELINQAIDKGRVDIQSAPEKAANYNQLAWLIGNTQGDFDEAVSLSQKSIVLMREEYARIGKPAKVGGYLDTLAHCYYAQGDYANAVKTQTEAARREPHSKQISRKLEVFRKALAESPNGVRAGKP